MIECLEVLNAKNIRSDGKVRYSVGNSVSN